MENEKILKMTNAVYSLLDLFPDEEPLKNRTKEKALVVLDGLISVSFLTGLEKEKIACKSLAEIEMLLGCLGLANRQGYLSKLNLIIISEEYKKTIEELKPIADAYKQKQTMAVPAEEPAFAKATAPEPRTPPGQDNPGPAGARQNPGGGPETDNARRDQKDFA
jgi:hypothetical protein